MFRREIDSVKYVMYVFQNVPREMIVVTNQYNSRSQDLSSSSVDETSPLYPRGQQQSSLGETGFWVSKSIMQ